MTDVSKTGIALDDVYGLRFWPALPAALVTTADVDGNSSIALVSIVTFQAYANIGPDPSPSDKLISIAIGDYVSPDNRRSKRTYKNAVDTGEFVVNFASMSHLSSAHATLQPVADKFAASGFTPEPSQEVRAPSIAECPLNFECELVKVDDTGAMTEILWGKVVAARIADHLQDLDGPELLAALDPIYNYSFGPRDGTYHRIGPQVKLGETDE